MKGLRRCISVLLFLALVWEKFLYKTPFIIFLRKSVFKNIFITCSSF